MTTLAAPLYLQAPSEAGRTYGSLEYDTDKDQWVITCEPAAAEFAKRLFPGVNTRRNGGELRFGATRRLTGELNWFLLRYPLTISDRARYDEQHRAAVEHALRRTEANDAPPRAPPPSFRGKLHAWQKKGLTFLLENERCVLAWEQGLGKTLAALAGIATADAFPALIVVKPGLLPTQWQEMIGEYLDLDGSKAPKARGQQARLMPLTEPDARVDLDMLLARGDAMSHVIRGTKPYDLPARPLYIISYNLLKDWKGHLATLGLKAIVFDEVHELRHATTSKYSAAVELATGTRYVWGLSGTPIFNYGDEIWSVLNVVDFHCLADRESFTIEWCTGYGQKVVKDPKALGAYLKEEGLLLRELKKNVQDQLPPKVRKVITIEHDDQRFRTLIAKAAATAARYDSIKNWHEKGLAKRQVDSESRAAAGEAKAPFAATFIRGLLRAGERVLVFAHHHVVHDILRDELAEFHPVFVTGEQSEKEKRASRAAFMRGDTNLAVIGLRSSAGLDGFQKRGSCVVFAELEWAPAIHSQAEDRIHRYGMDPTLGRVLSYYLVSDTGIDTTMQDALGLKKAQFVGIMGDKPETEDDRAFHESAANEHMDRVIEHLRSMAPQEVPA